MGTNIQVMIVVCTIICFSSSTSDAAIGTATFYKPPYVRKYILIMYHCIFWWVIFFENNFYFRNENSVNKFTQISVNPKAKRFLELHTKKKKKNCKNNNVKIYYEYILDTYQLVGMIAESDYPYIEISLTY